MKTIRSLTQKHISENNLLIKAITKYLIGLSMGLFIFYPLKAQEPLYILTEKMYDEASVDIKTVDSVLTEKIRELLNELNLSKHFYPRVEQKREINANENCIRLFTSLFYIKNNGDKNFSPIRVVRKRDWRTPYYYSYFIGRTESQFNSFRDLQTIKRIYLQANSMSGYYAPLYKLWEMGYIKNPSIKSIEDEWQTEVIVINGNSSSLIKAVAGDPSSVGATGEQELDEHTEVKFISMILPQDLICISNKLQEYETQIKTLVDKLFADTILRKKIHLLVTGTQPYSQEIMNAYEFNKYIIDTVNKAKDKSVYQEVNPPKDKSSFQDFLNKSTLSVYLWIAVILLVIYILGHKTGHVFLLYIRGVITWLKKQLFPLGDTRTDNKEIRETVGQPSTELKTYKIFLASSKELEKDRDNFEIFIGRENSELIKKGIYIQLVRWENFIDAMSKTRLQDEYNKTIKGCDIFLCLFFSKVGKYTEEEFEIAFGQFQETNKPLIFTYFKDGMISTEEIEHENVKSLFKFKKKLETLGHFRTIYKDIGDLQYKFKMQLQKFIKY